MRMNMGSADRAARIAMGLFFFAVAYRVDFSGVAILGLLPLVTGLFGFCPVYVFFKTDTLDATPIATTGVTPRVSIVTDGLPEPRRA